jgi:hypothetical protein
MGANLVTTLIVTLILGAAIGALEWLAFGSSFAGRYVYLSVGIVVAIVSVIQTIRRLTKRGATLFGQLMNSVVLQQALSSSSGKFKLALLLVKEAALRLTYWPVEFSLLAIEEKIEGAPNLVAKGAIGMHFSPRIPVIVASWMLAINLAFLALWESFPLVRGATFQFYVTICMLVTIVWFLDFFVNPIEVQLRRSGTAKEAALRFALVCALSVSAVVVLIYTYRLATTGTASLVAVISDVLFGGQFNAELKDIKDGIAKSLSNGDIKGVLAETARIDRSLLASMAVCILFYLTIGKRLLPVIFGRASLFRRTADESMAATSTSIQLGDLAAARQYASELPDDHSFHVMIKLRDALNQRLFDDAYGMIQDLVARARRQNKLTEPVVLDAREKWGLLASISSGLEEGLGDIDFAIWSIDRPFLELRDLAKFITSLTLHGGVGQISAFSHYLHQALENKGPRAELFRDRVVGRFLIGAWEKVSNEKLDSASFDTSFLDYLVASVQTDKAGYLLREAPLFRRVPDEMNERAFLDHFRLPDPGEWTDSSRFLDLESIDRFYIVDIMIGMAQIAKQSGGDDGAKTFRDISDARIQLEKHWGSPVFDRLGFDAKFMDQVGAAIGSTLG